MKKFITLLFLCIFYINYVFPQSPKIREVEIIEQHENITIGESFEIKVSVKNEGSESNDGGISISFPSFKGYSDSDYVTVVSSSADEPGVRHFDRGESIHHKDGTKIDADYLLMEFSDNKWEQNETNYIRLKVVPKEVGNFYIYIRSAMHVDGYYTNYPTSSGDEDQQGWDVIEYHINVHEKPEPKIEEFSVIPSSQEIVIGETFDITVEVENTGGRTDEAGISISFPEFILESDDNFIQELNIPSDDPGLSYYPKGKSIHHKDGHKIDASYLLVEFEDDEWKSGENNTVKIRVKPQSVGEFYIYARSAMGSGGVYTNTPVNSSTNDQQGWEVKTIKIDVTPPPPPEPTLTNIKLSTDEIALGDSFNLTVSSINNGGIAADGGINVSFPSFQDSDDDNHILDLGTDTGEPGLKLFPNDSEIHKKSGTKFSAQYLLSEYADADWSSGIEKQMKIQVTPKEEGDFVIYIRSAMGEGTDYVNDPSSSSIYDQQDWPVEKRIVKVSLPKPKLTNIQLSSTEISLGESFELSVSSRNEGILANDGGISVSFPDFKSEKDREQINVIEMDEGDPGFKIHPVNSTIHHKTNGEFSADYLLAEFSDSNWENGIEKSMKLAITPKEIGNFTIYIRSAMGVNSNYVNDPNDSEDSDQQGWEVVKYSVNVVAPPPPNPALTLQDLPDEITFGEVFDLTVRSVNNGGIAVDGGISVSFPNFTDEQDTNQIIDIETNSGDPGLKYFSKNSEIHDKDGNKILANYLLAEYADADWKSGIEKQMKIRVTPKEPGDFVVYIRSAMGAGTEYVNAPASSENTDQQGWEVEKHIVRVRLPEPELAEPEFSSQNIILGESFDLTVSSNNKEANADDGGISVSFPSFSDANDNNQIKVLEMLDGKFSFYPIDSTIHHKETGPFPAKYFLAEYSRSPWNNSEERTIKIRVTPKVTGEFEVFIRSAMGIKSKYNNDPSEGATTDQQGWPVQRFIVNVSPPPPPEPKIVSIDVSKDEIYLGDSFNLKVVSRNDGGVASDGGISVSFPSFTNSTDTSQVSDISTDSGIPGLKLYPTSSIIHDDDGNQFPAKYLLAEYADTDWETGVEKQLHLKLTPREEGEFDIYIRSAMSAEPKYINTPETSDDADQQNWSVTKKTVVVKREPPQPEITKNTVNPDQILLGDSFQIDIISTNKGGIADEGGISVSFPNFTGNDDNENVILIDCNDENSFKQHPVGSTIHTKENGTIDANYLLCEYAENNWQKGDQRKLSLKVTPQSTGEFIYNVRSAMSMNGVYTNCPETASDKDQQDWEVIQKSILVVQEQAGDRKSVTIQNLVFNCENITTIRDGEYILKGEININELLKFDGELELSKNQLKASGNGRIYIENIPILEQVDFYNGNFEFDIDEESLKMKALEKVNNLFELGGLSVELSAISIIDEGVQINGHIGMPSIIKGFQGDIATIEITKSKGVQLIGTISMENIVLAKKIEVDTLGLSFNTVDNNFDGALHLTTPLFGIGGTTQIIDGKLNNIYINVAPKNAIPLAGTGFSFKEINGRVENLVTEPIKLIVGISLIPTIQGNFDIVELNNLELTYTWGNEFTGSGNLQLFGEDVAEVALLVKKNLVDFKGHMNLYDVFEGKLEATISTLDGNFAVSGHLYGALMIPAKDGFPFDYLSCFIGLPYKIAETDNYLMNNIVAGNSKIGPFSMHYKATWEDRTMKIEYGKGYENWNEKLFPDDVKTNLKSNNLNRFEGKSIKIQNLLNKENTKFSGEYDELEFNLKDQTNTLIIRIKDSIDLSPFVIVMPNGEEISNDNLGSLSYFSENLIDDKLFYQFDNPQTGLWKLRTPIEMRDAFIDVFGADLQNSIVTDSLSRTNDGIVKVKWYSHSANDDAKVSLYYDQDQNSYNGVSIAKLNYQKGDQEYNWDTSELPSGVYSVYAVLEDTISTPVASYAPNSVRIGIDELEAPSNLSHQLSGDSILLTWYYPDAEDVKFHLYYGTSEDKIISNSYCVGTDKYTHFTEFEYGETFYFAVKAKSNSQTESDLSEVIEIQLISDSNNNKPSITDVTASQYCFVDSIYYATVEAVDLDNDSLNYTLSNEPSGMTINADGNIFWEPSTSEKGYHKYDIITSDAKGSKDSITIEVTVMDPNLIDYQFMCNRYQFPSLCDQPIVYIKDPLFEGNIEKLDTISIQLHHSSSGETTNVLLIENEVNSKQFFGKLSLMAINERIELSENDTIVFSHTHSKLNKTSEIVVSCKNLFHGDLISHKGYHEIYDTEVLEVHAKLGFSEYKWSDESTNDTIQISTSGDYYVTLTDAYGCSVKSDTLVVSVITGLNEIEEKSQVLIYPVPAKDYLNVSFEKLDIYNTDISIYDLSGRLILRKQINSNLTTIPLSNLKAGNYILRLRQSDNVKSFKFTVIR